MRPSLSTPVLMRNVLGCLVMVKNCSSIVSATFTGPAHDHRQRDRERLHLDVELAAEAAAEIRHLDADAVLRQPEQPRDLGAHERRALRAAIDGDAALLPVADRAVGLEREVQDFLGAERVLEHVRGAGECLVDVAAPQPEIERDVGAPAALEMLEVGEGAGGLEFLVHQRSRCRRPRPRRTRPAVPRSRRRSATRPPRPRADRGPARPPPARRCNAPCRSPGSAGRGTPARNRARGITFSTSSAVMTRWTPGTALAALTSIDLMRPCATVLR